ncbi:unnamed protein product [Gongylonema pulchrum]|uniref:Secreted protein n=1 Tax=Gongylonema pulchrum TaxID=637853 RepID=A0A183EGS0_9BILA|nr:unnamed protein product [Gongylonema pulchrum]
MVCRIVLLLLFSVMVVPNTASSDWWDTPWQHHNEHFESHNELFDEHHGLNEFHGGYHELDHGYPHRWVSWAWEWY